jgi:hypothetical protein
MWRTPQKSPPAEMLTTPYAAWNDLCVRSAVRSPCNDAGRAIRPTAVLAYVPYSRVDARRRPFDERARDLSTNVHSVCRSVRLASDLLLVSRWDRKRLVVETTAPKYGPPATRSRRSVVRGHGARRRLSVAALRLSRMLRAPPDAVGGDWGGGECAGGLGR